jgi:hypothetical protein
MRELGRHTEDEMREQLSDLDEGMEQLRALARLAGIFRRSD